MRKAIIYVFSATGNTELVANFYKQNLTAYETTIHKIRMENGIYLPFPSPQDYDMVGIAYPIHAFNAPKVVYDFCKTLPKVDNLKTFIAKSSGEGLFLNDYSSQKIIKLLERRGYVFCSERHYVLPHNIIFRHSQKLVKIEYTYAKAYAKASCKEIQAGKIDKVHKNFFAQWFLPILRIEWLYARLQGPLMKVDKKKCIHCNKCVNNCPLGNIRVVNGRYKFGTNCAMCTACFFNCPKNAITIGILNKVKLNGSYNVEKTAKDPNIKVDGVLESFKGVQKKSFTDYFARLDKVLFDNDIKLDWES